MSSIRPKRSRVRLDPVAYESLRQQVLRRDGWRCQLCGTMSNLEVHHKQFRSHSGDDSEENLITLCTRCHSSDTAMLDDSLWRLYFHDWWTDLYTDIVRNRSRSRCVRGVQVALIRSNEPNAVSLTPLASRCRRVLQHREYHRCGVCH